MRFTPNESPTTCSLICEFLVPHAKRKLRTDIAAESIFLMLVWAFSNQQANNLSTLNYLMTVKSQQAHNLYAGPNVGQSLPPPTPFMHHWLTSTFCFFILPVLWERKWQVNSGLRLLIFQLNHSLADFGAVVSEDIIIIPPYVLVWSFSILSSSTRKKWEHTLFPGLVYFFPVYPEQRTRGTIHNAIKAHTFQLFISSFWKLHLQVSLI